MNYGRFVALSPVALALACTSAPTVTDTGSARDDAAIADDAYVASDAWARPDAGTDAGGGLAGGNGIRWLPPSMAIDLTPDGSIAVVEDPGTGEVSFYDVDLGTLRVVTDVGDPAHDFATAISATQRLSALEAVPVVAGTWTQASDWTALDSPFATGCDMEIASAWDVSADGNIVVGMAWEGCQPAAVRWTRASDGTETSTTLMRLGARQAGGTGSPANRATVISDDGTVIAGWAETDMTDRWPAIWRADGTGFLLPGSVPDAPGEVLSISADGSMVAGTWNLEAFVWTEAGGVVSLGVLPGGLGGDAAYANAIAADGALVFGGSGGFGATTAFVWTAASGMRPLADVLTAAGIAIPSQTSLTNVLAASTDGRVLLGTAATDSGSMQSFVVRVPVAAYGL